MLSIGEFSNICKVSTKTLRYYAEIGLLQPYEINEETRYRYYAIEQLETMLLIERLKSYQFSLEEIKELLSQEEKEELLYRKLHRKQQEMKQRTLEYQRTIAQMDDDLSLLSSGKSILSYLDAIDIQLVEVDTMCVLSKRCMLHEDEIADAYKTQYTTLLKRIAKEKLTICKPPMVLFHTKEFTPFGLDIEFAFAIQEVVTGTHDFYPGLCIKTVLEGSYTNLPSIYTKQWEWMEKHQYEDNGPVFELYHNDPSEVSDERELRTEVYRPIKKIR